MGPELHVMAATQEPLMLWIIALLDNQQELLHSIPDNWNYTLA